MATDQSAPAPTSGGAAEPADPGIGQKIKQALVWSTINNLVIRVASLGSGILLAWLLSPDQFGVFAVALTVQAILITVAELGMSADLIRKGRIDERAGTATTVGLVTSGVLAVAMCIAARPVATALGAESATSVIRVMSLTLILSGVSVVPYAKIQRGFRQSTQMGLDGASLVVSTVITVLLVLAGFGAMSLAISRVAGQALTCGGQFLVTKTRLRFGFDRRTAIELLRFGIPLALANLLSWVVMTMPNVVTGRWLGAIALGLFVQASNISSWPMNAIGTAVRSVALPGFAQVGDLRRRGNTFNAAAALAWAGALLAGLLLSSLATALIPFLYGNKWFGASAALAGLGYFGALRILTDLMATYLIAAGASRRVLIVQIVWLVVLGPALVLGVRIGGFAGISWAQTIVLAAVVLPIYAVMLRGHHVPVGAFLRNLGVPALVAVPAALVGIVVAHNVHQHFLALALGGTLGTVVFVAPIYGWLRRRLAELRGATSGGGAGGSASSGSGDQAGTVQPDAAIAMA